MSWKCDKVGEPPLPPARDDEEYLLHEAALAWGLADSIVIQSVEDIRSRAGWLGRLDPFHHQIQNLFTFCRRLPVSLLADDVGLGKTVSAGLILGELMARKRVSRALILCPKILCQQWVEELGSKFGMAATAAAGDTLDAKLAGPARVVVTTYESAAGRLGALTPGAFDLLVLDEAHKLRNLHEGAGRRKPKADAAGPKKKKPTEAKPTKETRAMLIRDALERRLFKFVVMLTATPIQNRIWDLYSLIDCLTAAKGHKNPFGEPREFAGRFLDPASEGRRLRPEAADEFRAVLRQYVVRTRREDARLQFPTRDVSTVRVTLTPPEEALAGLLAGHIAELNHLQQTSLAQAMMSSPRAFAAQMANMAEKTPALAEDAVRAKALAEACAEPAKLTRLLVMCREMRASRPDWRVVVFTGRKETQSGIGEALSREGIAHGFIQGGRPRENQSAIERLRADPPGIHVLVSTDAGAEGVNLQAANVLVNYDLPWNPMVVEQRIGRLQRLSSEHRHVLIRNLVAAGSVEERVVGRLMEKLQGIAQAIGDIESIIQSPEWGDGDEAKFEARIRELVVKSLLGQDVEQATRLAQESIDKARRQIEEVRAEIDQALGRLDELHRAGPRMPRLARPEPVLPADEFVARALRAEGAEAPPGGIEPGSPEFERLVADWSARAGHRVRVARADDAVAERLVRDWFAALPDCRVVSSRIGRRVARFSGRALVKVKASNGVDAYEKLVAHDLHPEGHPPIPPSEHHEEWLTTETKAGGASPGAAGALARAAEADPDVGEFCRFYLERRAEELAAAGDDPRLRHKVNGDFTPLVTGDAVGFRGVRYDELRFDVRFSVRGEADYEAALHAVPAAAALIAPPGVGECGLTGARVPAVCLEVCQPEGVPALRHLLEASEVSGRWVRRGQLVTCEVTKKKACADEAARSAVSGTLALRSLLLSCAETGGLMLDAESGTSAASGMVVRRDLLTPCAVTGGLALAGELAVCAATGKRAMKSLMVTCAQTGDPVLRSEAGVSDLSGKPARPDLLHRSDRKPGRRGLADEMAACEATRKRLLRDEVGRCVLTGRAVDAALLNVRGELRALRELLEGQSADVRCVDGLGPRIAALHPAFFSGLRHVWAVELAGTRTLAVCVELRTWLGWKVRYAGFLLEQEPAFRIVGRAVRGWREKGVWVGEDHLDFA